ncbi:hypothetical protein GCM10009672_22220 [Nesterenkonia lutea]
MHTLITQHPVRQPQSMKPRRTDMGEPHARVIPEESRGLELQRSEWSLRSGEPSPGVDAGSERNDVSASQPLPGDAPAQGLSRREGPA